jgi:hypothetical protein
MIPTLYQLLVTAMRNTVHIRKVLAALSLELVRPGLTMLLQKLVAQFLIQRQNVSPLGSNAAPDTLTGGLQTTLRVCAYLIVTTSELDLSVILPASFPGPTTPMPNRRPATAPSVFAHQPSDVHPTLPLPGIRMTMLVAACLRLKLSVM